MLTYIQAYLILGGADMKQVFTADVARYILYCAPDAIAWISGSEEYPNIAGKAYFWQMEEGVFVEVEVKGLPIGSESKCNDRIFALHIHEGSSCTGNSEDPFADAGQHYNPEGCLHPAHAGDLPPLFSNDGIAWYAMLTNRFKVVNIIGRTLIIHSGPDDFTTQPSGKAGDKLACGTIKINHYS
jgi:Cu-Zn family superoxide dismutase